MAVEKLWSERTRQNDEWIGGFVDLAYEEGDVTWKGEPPRAFCWIDGFGKKLASRVSYDSAPAELALNALCDALELKEERGGEFPAQVRVAEVDMARLIERNVPGLHPVVVGATPELDGWSVPLWEDMSFAAHADRAFAPPFDIREAFQDLASGLRAESFVPVTCLNTELVLRFANASDNTTPATLHWVESALQVVWVDHRATLLTMTASQLDSALFSEVPTMEVGSPSDSVSIIGTLRSFLNFASKDQGFGNANLLDRSLGGEDTVSRLQRALEKVEAQGGPLQQASRAHFRPKLQMRVIARRPPTRDEIRKAQRKKRAAKKRRNAFSKSRRKSG